MGLRLLIPGDKTFTGPELVNGHVDFVCEFGRALPCVTERAKARRRVNSALRTIGVDLFLSGDGFEVDDCWGQRNCRGVSK